MPNTSNQFIFTLFLIFFFSSKISSQECSTKQQYIQYKNSNTLSKKYVERNSFSLTSNQLKIKLGTRAGKLGSGTFGDVFHYYSPDGDQLAVKFLKRDQQSQYEYTLIYLEMNASSCLIEAVNQAPAFASLYALITAVYKTSDTGQIVFVMNHFPTDLEKYGNKYYKLAYTNLNNSQQDKLDNLMLIIATSLNFLHENNMVHRDLKPANIMMDSEGTPIIGDFGLLSLEDEMFSTISGTPSFMDVNLIATGKGSTASDVYSLGIIYYMLVNGVSSISKVNQMLVNGGYDNKYKKLNLNPNILNFPLKYAEFKPMLDKSPDNRPSTSDVISIIKGIIRKATQLPEIIPKKQQYPRKEQYGKLIPMIQEQYPRKEQYGKIIPLIQEMPYKNKEIDLVDYNQQYEKLKIQKEMNLYARDKQVNDLKYQQIQAQNVNHRKVDRLPYINEKERYQKLLEQAVPQKVKPNVEDRLYFNARNEYAINKAKNNQNNIQFYV